MTSRLSLIIRQQKLRHFRSLLCAPTKMHFSTEDADRSKESTSGWIPDWIKGTIQSKIPAALGGSREEVSKLSNLTLDDYAESLKQARRMGGLTGYASGTSNASDVAAQGTLRLFESIIGAMSALEKKDVTANFGKLERERVASDVGCTVSQVDDCIARYLWMRQMTSKLADLRRQGKPMPTSIDEVESLLGSWRQYKTESSISGLHSSLHSEGESSQLQGNKGRQCPFEGMSSIGRSTKCPLTKKSFKSCCGRKK